MAGFYADQFGNKKKKRKATGKNTMGMKFKQGDLVEVIGNAGGHNQVGMEFEIQGYMGMYIRCEGSQFNFVEQDLKLMPLSKERVVKKCEEAKHEFALLQSKLEYLEEMNLAEVDEGKFRTFQVKKLIENKKLTPDEKAERISFLFN